MSWTEEWIQLCEDKWTLFTWVNPSLIFFTEQMIKGVHGPSQPT